MVHPLNQVYYAQRARRAPVHPNQLLIEQARRARVGRAVRARLRRMEPVVLLLPRWSSAESFLESIAWDLARQRPSLGCRTVSFKPLKGRGLADAWRYTLAVFAQLAVGVWTEVRAPLVGSRHGWRNAALSLLLKAQTRPGNPVALLGIDVEHLPVVLMDDLNEVWSRFTELVPAQRQTGLLLSGPLGAPNLKLSTYAPLVLEDYSVAEAVEAMPEGVDASIAEAVRLCGGIPVLVDALGKLVEQGVAPSTDPDTLMMQLRGHLDEIRGAVAIAMADPLLADRLDVLLKSPTLPTTPSDHTLMLSGLVRSGRATTLRFPACSACL